MAGAVICGIGGGVLWVAQGKYMSECGTNANKGLYASIFWVFFNFSQVIGNLMGAFVITKVPESTLYFILTGCCFIAAFMFLVLTDPEQEIKQLKVSTVDSEVLNNTKSIAMIEDLQLTML